MRRSPGERRVPTSRTRRVLLAGLTLAVSLLAVELLCMAALFLGREHGLSREAFEAARTERMADVQGGQFSSPQLEVLHPYLGFVYDPAGDGPELREHHGGVPISEYGFLDEGPPLRPAAEGTVVVGVFGGSFAYYFSVHGLPALLHGLAGIPEFRGKRFEVVRVALGGYKQPQQLLALVYLLSLGAHFDVVVNLDGFNEVALPAVENVRQGVFPFFPRNWNTRVSGVPGHAGLAAMVRILDLRERRRAWAARFQGSLLASSAAANLVWWLRDRQLGARLTEAQLELVRAGSRPDRFEASGPPYAYRDDAALFEDLAAVWAEASRAMARISRAYGIRYWHFLQPNQYVAGSKPMGESEREIALHASDLYRRAVQLGYPSLRARGATLAAEGVRFHDLVEVYRDHEEPLYTDACCHVNELGYAIVGEAIAEDMAADLEAERARGGLPVPPGGTDREAASGVPAVP